MDWLLKSRMTKNFGVFSFVQYIPVLFAQKFLFVMTNHSAHIILPLIKTVPATVASSFFLLYLCMVVRRLECSTAINIRSVFRFVCSTYSAEPRNTSLGLPIEVGTALAQSTYTRTDYIETSIILFFSRGSIIPVRHVLSAAEIPPLE